MSGIRVARPTPRRWAIVSLLAVLVSAVIVHQLHVVWLTAPAAAVMLWVGGSSAAALLLGRHGRGRFFQGVLGLVLAVVLLLVVGLVLHYSGWGISRSAVVSLTSLICGVLVVTTAVLQRGDIGSGFVPMRDLIGAALAGVVLVGAGGVAVAIQPHDTSQYELLTLTDPAIDSTLDDRRVAAGGSLFVSWELHSFGYRIAGQPRVSTKLGNSVVDSADIVALPRDAAGESAFRGSTEIVAPATKGVFRVRVTVTFAGPDGDSVTQSVNMVVIVE